MDESDESMSGSEIFRTRGDQPQFAQGAFQHHGDMVSCPKTSQWDNRGQQQQDWLWAVFEDSHEKWFQYPG